MKRFIFIFTAHADRKDVIKKQKQDLWIDTTLLIQAIHKFHNILIKSAGLKVLSYDGLGLQSLRADFLKSAPVMTVVLSHVCVSAKYGVRGAGD